MLRGEGERGRGYGDGASGVRNESMKEVKQRQARHRLRCLRRQDSALSRTERTQSTDSAEYPKPQV